MGVSTDRYAAEEAGDAECAHGADDGDGHIEGPQGDEGERDHDEVEPASLRGGVAFSEQFCVLILLVRSQKICGQEGED